MTKTLATILYLSCLLLTPNLHATNLEAQNQTLSGYFFTAARTGELAVIDKFIQAGISPDIRNPQSYTPLMMAAYHGHYQLVEHLLSSGANPCLQDKRGNTALMAAIFKVEIRIARKLMSADCDLSTTNKQGLDALSFADLYRQKQIVNDLLERQTP